ncbi:MAG: exodeoxyribonuclease VII small subunit [Acidimicrobiaceae bacterium]|jgi:exodeoxyribonuclease VII small subunit|nr:exodeoxyribonuclease VII small subunit [Acidimicrobiaceae bacterium]MCH2626545.1 exodeoxyribonuclease VII small subunit [Acidimicrobiales bacterium]MEC9114617.1 exodeoxyribonuclease VII small subunit [Actinomycetota bacterium]|tara:strand:- start:236 stop:439 length:204 start_codon:yes stop_codon:yes gene_type:complete
MSDEELTFEAATQELDSILEKLDGDGVNIDSLAVDLQRASQLIEWCRARLETTRVEVERIVADLDDN